MKKIVGIVLFSIITVSLLVTMFSVSANSSDDIIYITEEYTPIVFSPETELDIPLGANMNRFYGSGEQVDTTTFFYKQLTSNQKELYNQIWAAGPVANVAIDISGLNYTTATDINALSEVVGQDIMMAMTALNEDRPMFFWQDGFSYSVGYQNPSDCDGNTTITFKSLDIEIKLETANFTDYNDVIEKQAELIEKINSIPVYGFSRHEKVKSINDYLANNIVYQETANAHNPYGAIINGLCVCEGYAEAFKILCDREGIPCLNVVGDTPGGAHKWNMVQMEDNQWYLIDVTWNDQTDNANAPFVFYSYLLIGSNTKAPYFSNKTVPDSTVHMPTGKHYSSADPLVYPVLSTDTYGVGLLDYAAKDVQFDATRGVIMVGKDVASYSAYILNDPATDFRGTRKGSGTTTSTMTVSDSVTTKTYLVAMRGDIDASDATNTTDYTVMTQVCSTTATVDEGTAKFYAGDMNQDGAIDGFDAIAHQLYTNGTLLYN